MAADDRSTGSTPPTPAGGWLVLALAAVTAYVAWQIAPLSARMDALERDRLATEDRLLGEIEKIANRVALL